MIIIIIIRVSLWAARFFFSRYYRCAFYIPTACPFLSADVLVACSSVTAELGSKVTCIIPIDVEDIDDLRPLSYLSLVPYICTALTCPTCVSSAPQSCPKSCFMQSAPR